MAEPPLSLPGLSNDIIEGDDKQNIFENKDDREMQFVPTENNFVAPWSRSLGGFILGGSIFSILLAIFGLLTPNLFGLSNGIATASALLFILSLLGIWFSAPYLLNKTHIEINNNEVEIYTTPKNCFGRVGCNYKCNINQAMQFQTIEKAFDNLGRPRIICLQLLVVGSSFGVSQPIECHEWAATFINWQTASEMTESLNITLLKIKSNSQQVFNINEADTNVNQGESEIENNIESDLPNTKEGKNE